MCLARRDRVCEFSNIISYSFAILELSSETDKYLTFQFDADLGHNQTYVATLATVLPPRHQTATLVYSNPQQLGTNVTGPRLAVANPIATQRQVRPIQISSARLPTAGLSRVNTATGCK